MRGPSLEYCSDGGIQVLRKEIVGVIICPEEDAEENHSQMKTLAPDPKAASKPKTVSSLSG